MSKCDLERKFEAAMFEIYKRAKDEASYNATIFAQMLIDRGGFETDRHLINSPTVSTGYTALWERGRLDLTVEATVLSSDDWKSLFTKEELQSARKRLKAYNYSPY